jgi:hypothetical protein
MGRLFSSRRNVPEGPKSERGPRKGLLTQCVCVLVDAVPSLYDGRRQPADFLALFNPNGELLLPAEVLRARLERDARGEALAVDAWANVRMYRLPRDGADWMVYDTVGMGQLDVCDHQALLPFGHESSRHVPGLLHSIAEYDADKRGVIGLDDTATDDGGCRWRAYDVGQGLVPPPRRVVWWAPTNVRVPDDLRRSVEDET